MEKDCCRVQFFTHREDSLTQEKYTNLGAICLPEWLTVRLPNPAMRKFANEDNIVNLSVNVLNILYNIRR